MRETFRVEVVGRVVVGLGAERRARGEWGWSCGEASQHLVGGDGRGWR